MPEFFTQYIYTLNKAFFGWFLGCIQKSEYGHRSDIKLAECGNKING